jgi:predicted DNA-binding antitoxin AbrB/MazE fold protein
MSQVITATFENGVLRPEQDLGLAPGTRVRLKVDVCMEGPDASPDACDELDNLCDESPIVSQEPRRTRDQLHERD